MRIVQDFFHSDDTVPEVQTERIISVSNDLKNGQRLKQMMDNWSRGHEEPEDFIFQIMLVTLWYEDGSRSKGDMGEAKQGIQLGI